MARDLSPVSVMLPVSTRERLAAVAAARGESLEGLVHEAVERFLAVEAREGPRLETVLARLRAYGPVLDRRGIEGLWVFGSVARGEAGPESDVDLLVEFRAGRELSLLRFASLRTELSDVLGAPADLADRRDLLPAVREATEREAVRVL